MPPARGHSAEAVRFPLPRYCALCGQALAERTIKAGEPARSVCGACGYIAYPDPKVAACVVCHLGGKVLLLRRGIEPAYGKWVFPGGFLDRGEKVEEAARREAREEAGVEVGIERLVNVYSYPGEPVVVIVYEGRVLRGVPQARDETLEVRLFDRSEIPWDELAFRSTRDALRDYFRGR